MDKKGLEKEAIIAEYLTGEISYRKIGEKYGIDFRLIHSWVTKFQGKPMRKKPKKELLPQAKEEQLPKEVKQLQAALRKAELHNNQLTGFSSSILFTLSRYFLSVVLYFSMFSGLTGSDG